MEPNQVNELSRFYQRATSLMIKQEMSANYTIKELMNDGISEEQARQIVDDIKENMRKEGEANGLSAMAIGGLSCIAGLFGTFAGTGHIFWGAIVFGGIWFFRGVDRYLGHTKHL